MFSLIIDTSTEECLLGLLGETGLLAEAIFPHKNLLSKNLLPSIQNLLATHGASPQDLSYIAAGIGPGSYTGTRLGCAVAKSLSFGLGIPVKPFLSPLAFLPDREGSFAFVMPTRAGAYYVVKGVQEAKKVEQHSAGLVEAERLFGEIEGVDFVICQDSPKGLSTNHLCKPTPNLAVLAQFLQHNKAVSPEEVELQYLHTP